MRKGVKPIQITPHNKSTKQQTENEVLPHNVFGVPESAKSHEPASGVGVSSKYAQGDEHSKQCDFIWAIGGG
jgi:hypothetical protein